MCSLRGFLQDVSCSSYQTSDKGEPLEFFGHVCSRGEMDCVVRKGLLRSVELYTSSTTDSSCDCISIGLVGKPDGDEQLGREPREGLAVTMNPFPDLIG